MINVTYFEDKDPETGKAIKHQKAALEAVNRKKAAGISNIEVKPSDKNGDKVRYQELEKLYGLEKKDAKLIEDEAGSKITEVNEWNDEKTFTFEDEQEWLIFESEDDAEEAAIKHVEESIDDNPENVPAWNLTNNLDAERAEYLFREIYDESNSGYVDGIEDEENDEFTNRLASEMYEYDIITYEEATDESFDLEDKKEEMVEKMTDDAISEGNYGYDYYESNFGKDEALKLIIDRGLIDTRVTAEDIINQYGIANELAHYDSAQVDLSNGMVMFRQD